MSRNFHKKVITGLAVWLSGEMCSMHKALGSSLSMGGGGASREECDVPMPQAYNVFCVFFSLIFLFFFYLVYGCFACMNIYAPYMCLMLSDVKRSYWIPWN